MNTLPDMNRNPPPPTEMDGSRSSPAAKSGPPTPQQRLERVHEFQCQALQNPDPLMASLEIMTGDLIQFAFRIRERMTDNLSAGDNAVEQEQFLRQADTYLKFVRQVDRLAHLGRQQPKTAKPASDPTSKTSASPAVVSPMGLGS
jgi:hypothetical protein